MCGITGYIGDGIALDGDADAGDGAAGDGGVAGVGPQRVRIQTAAVGGRSDECEVADAPRV